MKTAILSILVLFAFINMSAFGHPSNACLDACQSDFDFCDDNCGGTINCDDCDNELDECINSCYSG